MLTPNGEMVGEAYFHVTKCGHLVHSEHTSVFVDEVHRRKGIATAMYEYAELKSGLKIIPSGNRTALADLFWSQENRPFGIK